MTIFVVAGCTLAFGLILGWSFKRFFGWLHQRALDRRLDDLFASCEAIGRARGQQFLDSLDTGGVPIHELDNVDTVKLQLDGIKAWRSR